MEEDNTIKKYEIVDNREYADMIFDYIEWGGTKPRKPKEWHPELLYNSKLHQGAKVTTDISKVEMSMSPAGLLMIVEYCLSKENLNKYNNSLKSGNKFKIFIPKDKKIRIIFDKNLKESIEANNKRVGYKQYDKDIQMSADFLSLDIKEGRLIIKSIIRE
ncbi:MAG: hypothetical protein WC428_07135 [Candidatus Paceibacterota bacterium]|jgi:hypothetical protein